MRLYRCKTGLGQRDGNTYEYANDAELRANYLTETTGTQWYTESFEDNSVGQSNNQGSGISTLLFIAVLILLALLGE